MRLMRISILLMMALTVMSSAAVAAERPNIIVIYTDDQGYGDVSALNPEAKFSTPNLDRLAAEGVAFTNAHSADSVCTPSRYGLLTGRYPWRTSRKRGVMGAEGECLIADSRLTLASFLKAQGYRTGMVGKWHLGMDFPGEAGSRDWSQPVQNMPLDKGFDYYFGIPASLNYGVLAWFEGRFAEVPPTLFTNKKPNARHSDYRIMPPYDATPDETRARLKREGFEVAADFVDNECLTRFTDKALDWLTSQAADARAGRPFFLYLPYTSPHYPVCPLPAFHGQGACGAYGEFVIETDFHVGRVLEFLDRSGLSDNTLVVFTSDNGPENSWKQRIPDFGHDSRGGYRGGKRSVYEGGHRVPFLVRWPRGIASPGRTWDRPIGQVDLLATVADVLEAPLPVDAAEDSHSFAAVLVDPDSQHQRLPLVNHANGGGEYRYSITDGDWKLILPSPKTAAELYDLSEDPAETTDLSDQAPEQVERLTTLMNRLVTRGRTTAGPAQPNDTDYWNDLSWLTADEYQAAVQRAQQGR